MATDRVVHCWADGPRDDTGRGSTCMELEGHAGPHVWVRDDEIMVQFKENSNGN